MRRHLRKIFIDPLTGQQRWGIERREGVGIVGFYSEASGTPLKQEGFDARNASFAGAQSYRAWIFAFVPPEAAPTRTAGLPTAQSPAPFEPIPLAQPLPSTAAAPEPLTPCEQQRRDELSACSALHERGSTAAAGRCTLLAAVHFSACRNSN
jgi:hypothetical protein